MAENSLFHASFELDGGSVFFCGRYAEMLSVRPGKGRIIVKARRKTGVRRTASRAQQFSGQQQPLICLVLVDGRACFSLEAPHHMIFADKKPGGEGVDREVLGQIIVDKAEDLPDLFILRSVRTGQGIRSARTGDDDAAARRKNMMPPHERLDASFRWEYEIALEKKALKEEERLLREEKESSNQKTGNSEEDVFESPENQSVESVSSRAA